MATTTVLLNNQNETVEKETEGVSEWMRQKQVGSTGVDRGVKRKKMNGQPVRNSAARAVLMRRRVTDCMLAAAAAWWGYDISRCQ